MNLTAEHASKRKHTSDGDVPALKKPRIAITNDSSPAASHYFLTYEPILERLRTKYNVKTMSVMPSTSIKKHVDKALEHLGYFSAWDETVLPGVVFFSAKLAASNKLITIAELVRRRIGESEQKWYQYNLLGETECEAAVTEAPSVVGAISLRVGRKGSGLGDSIGDYFEKMDATTSPSIHDRALSGIKTQPKSYLSIFFSRVPLSEIRAIPDILLQTNEETVELLPKMKAGIRIMDRDDHQHRGRHCL